MNDELDIEEPTFDYIGMLKRRKLSIIIPALVVMVIAIVFALGLPAIYESRATILIQGQQVPKDLVPSTIETYAGQQVQFIRQMVIRQENVERLAKKFNLYSKSGSGPTLPGTELVERFEENMSLELISADIIDSRGRETSVVIAFDIVFHDPSGPAAQKVVNDLATMFLEENFRIRTERAEGAEEFITAESALLDAELKRIESQIAEFKEQHEGNLPAQYSFNFSTLERTERQVLDYDFRMSELQKRQIQLEAQLAQLNPSAPVVLSTGQVVLSDMDRLNALQSEYRRVAAIYNDNHPDVVRLQDEIATLQSELGVETDEAELRKQLADQRNYLSSLEGKYTEDHQEIQNTRQLISMLEREVQNAQSATASGFEPEPDNPAYILLRTQLDLVVSEIDTATNKLKELEQKLIDYEILLAEAPQVEREYTAILREYDNASSKYQELQDKQRETAIARNLEQERKGQRFLLIDPASTPTAPVSPNRPMIFLMGFALAIGSGLGLAIVRETLDESIRGTNQLQAIIGVPPLVTIPYIENREDVAASAHGKRIVLITAGVTVLVLVLFVHFFYRPLDVLFYIILNKLGV